MNTQILPFILKNKEKRNTMKQSTEELKNEITNSDTLESWSEDKKDSLDEVTLAEYLKRMLEIHNTSKMIVITQAQLDTTYGYQIFQGKKHPSRDILLKLAFGFPLTVDETNHLLYYGNVGSLYPRVKRDAYIMFALHQKYTVIQTNEYLYAHNERTLSI